MADVTRQDLSKYRLAKAAEMLAAARRDLAAGDFASANNRAYYCIFHAMRAVLALDGGGLQKALGGHRPLCAAIPENAAVARPLRQVDRQRLPDPQPQRSDYEDFYICSVDDTRQLVSGAEAFWQSVSTFLQRKYTDA